MDKNRFGKKLQLARKDRKLTSEKLSEACHLNATYVRQIEAGAKIPSLPVFVTICRELKVSPSFLLAEELQDAAGDEMDVLMELWQKASPSQLKLITAIVKGALSSFDE